MLLKLAECRDKQYLVCVMYVKDTLERKVIWGRIVKVNASENKVLIYDVDTQSVSKLNIRQIEEVVPSK